MKMLSVAVDERFAKSVDEAIAASGAYSSRSEFLKDAIRKNLEELMGINSGLLNVRGVFRKAALKAKARGWDGTLLSREEKDKIAEEWIKKNNIKLV